MKKISTGLIVVIVIVAILLIGVFWGISLNNSLIKQAEQIDSYKAEIDNQLKRRADLIPNLVNTIKGATGHELDVVNSITSSREKMLSGNTQDKLNASQDLTRNINLIIENYPNITTTPAFTALQDELAGTENRITVARGNYNKGVKEFNQKIKTFPNSLVASIFNHKEMSYLEITEQESQTPVVDFGH